MSGSTNSKKREIKKVWLISYLIVFLMPLLVGAIAGTLIYKGFREQVKERNNIVLESICTTVDNNLETVVEASLQLYNNEQVNEIGKNFDLPLSSEEHFYIYQFLQHIKDIRGYDTIDNYAKTFFMYFSGIDHIVQTSSAQSVSEFYNAKVNKEEYTENEWLEFIKKEYDSDFLNARLLSGEKELLFIRTLKLRTEDERYINAVYKIDTEQILSDVENLYFYEYGNFFVTDTEGNIIMSTNDDENNAGSKDKVLTFTKKSDFTGWTYTYAIPSNIAYGNVYKILIVMVCLYGLCLVGGIWLIRHFVRLNYKPIDKLMTLFNEDENDGKENEFSYLSDKITESLSRNFALNQEIDSQSKMIREHLISEMLQGHPPVGRRSKTELENLEFNLEEDSFAVLVYSLGNKDTDDLSMKQFVLCNVTDELLSNENYRFVSTKKEADVIYIIRIDDDSFVQKIKETAQFLLDFTKKELDFEFYCALGSVYSGGRSMLESYSEAKRAVEYLIASGNKSFAEYKDISTSLREGYFYSVELESRLVNLLKANEQKKMETLLQDIFTKNIGDEVSLDSIRYLTVELFATVKRLLAQYGYSAEKEYPEETEFIEHIFEKRDIEKMQEVIMSVYSSCGKNVFEVLSHKDDLISGVILYIKKNYSNQNLGIRLIGEAFSMNADYISRRFRESTEKTINDYIRDVRIEKAKRLLKESDELIADIAEMVGFTSYRTFVRVFTDTVGVTPNKYKTMK